MKPKLYDDYESGPFCRHWDDMGCTVKCARCGHSCLRHGIGNDLSCDDCNCREWLEVAQGPKEDTDGL